MKSTNSASALEILNRSVGDQAGFQKVCDAAASLTREAIKETSPLLHPFFEDEGICLICTSSLDSSGRAQRSMRLFLMKRNFRPWHITWIAHFNTEAPEGLQYSHRCHNGNCINPRHGFWETDQANKDRNSCRSGSHVILPDDKIILLCPHEPTCLTPVHIFNWDDKRVLNK